MLGANIMLIDINDEVDFLQRNPALKEKIEIVIEECLRTEDIHRRLKGSVH